MSWRPGGAASLRLEAEGGLGSGPEVADPHLHASPPRILPLAAVAAAVCALSGLGVLPGPASAALDLGAAGCYGLALRAALPRWPDGPSGRLGWLNGMTPVVLPLAALTAACVALPQRPDLPWLVLLPLWALVVLTASPWLEAGLEHGYGPNWSSTALAVLAISVPLPIFALVFNPTVPAVVRALAAGAAVAVPTWRLVALSQRQPGQAWRRALVVVALLAVAAAASAWLQVPAALLPVALLLGWYGLTGVVSQRDGQSMASFVAFVVAAAVMMAVAAPA
ncbi:MAG: DUF5656 family protein [Candidatus Dormibacteria bacterium]